MVAYTYPLPDVMWTMFVLFALFARIWVLITIFMEEASGVTPAARARRRWAVRHWRASAGALDTGITSVQRPRRIA